VLRVGTRMTAIARRGARTYGKSDSIDALAVARAALREPGLPQATHDPKLRELKLLVDHREDLVGERTAAQGDRRPGAPDGPGPACVSGVGELVAARILVEAGGPGRFVSDAALARHAGCAPIEVPPDRTRRHRLSRLGNRKLNATLHLVVLTQARVHPPARAYLARKRAQGKSNKGAFRCLKRHLVRVVFRALREPEVVPVS
jgi:transposase